MTENRFGGNGPATEHGETALDESRVVAAVLESSDGDLAEAKEKFSSNMAMTMTGAVAVGPNGQAKMLCVVREIKKTYADPLRTPTGRCGYE